MTVFISGFVNPDTQAFHLRAFNDERDIGLHLKNNESFIRCDDKPSHDAIWSENGWLIPINKDELINGELNWQQTTLKNTRDAIAAYESDVKIPEIYSELRVTTFNEGDYFALLGDRKLLAEYVLQSNFPDCGRPKLSGLA